LPLQEAAQAMQDLVGVETEQQAHLVARHHIQGKRMKNFIPRECPPDRSHPVRLSSVSAGFRL
jgi:hypothetical protein